MFFPEERLRNVLDFGITAQIHHPSSINRRDRAMSEIGIAISVDISSFDMAASCGTMMFSSTQKNGLKNYKEQIKD